MTNNELVVYEQKRDRVSEWRTVHLGKLAAYKIWWSLINEDQDIDMDSFGGRNGYVDRRAYERTERKMIERRCKEDFADKKK